jgi:hypothetical protein
MKYTMVIEKPDKVEFEMYSHFADELGDFPTITICIRPADVVGYTWETVIDLRRHEALAAHAALGVLIKSMDAVGWKQEKSA